MRVTIKSDELAAAARDMSLTADRAEHAQLLSGVEVRREFEHSSARRFGRGLRQAGREWRLEKQRRGLSSRPMRASGGAFAALTRHAGPRAGSVVFTVTRDGVVFGVRAGRSDLSYLQAHARGYTTSSGRQRPRRVVVIDRQGREAIADIVLRRTLANA